MIMNAHNRFTAGLTVAVLLALAPSAAWAAPSVIGKWLTDDGAAIIGISRCGKRVCGVIDRVLDPAAPKNDINNPDARLRTEPLAGTYVLRDFVQSGSKWENGSVYDPKTGNTYRSKMELLDNGDLKVTGCVLFVCRSRIWTRPD